MGSIAKQIHITSVRYFKGDFDPSSHKMSYRNIMALYNHSDSLMCKMFHSTLKEYAMKWYVELLSESIIDFKTLSDEFMEIFSTYKKVKHGADTLFLINQRDDESFRD